MFGHQTQSEWFFDSSVHLEAVSRLLYLVESHEPLGLVQGPDGSGRSRVLGRLREELSRTGIMTVPLPLSGMDEESALWQLAEGLCARLRPSMRRHELLSLVRDELSGRGRCGVQTVILLDDFHRAAAGLVYLPGSADGHRLRHVMEHAKDNTSKEIHGVYDGERDEILAVIDEAFTKAKKGGTDVRSEKQNGRRIYTVNLKRRIGQMGGQQGERQGNPECRYLRMVIENDVEVVTAYPTKSC
jgi:hypothetical protein